jgi:4-carboxymuconolactone decarboxylase
VPRAVQARIALPDDATLSPEQRAVRDQILATRGNLDGPFLAWLHSPGLAQPAQALGAHCRYHSGLSLQASELLILCVADALDCEAERLIHSPIALRAGVPPEAVAALARHEAPVLADPGLALLHELASSLLRQHRWPDALYARARAHWSERELVEIAGIIGYYSLVAMTLNAFEMRP